MKFVAGPYLSLNMPFSPKIFRIPRPISFFLEKKIFRASREKGPQKLNSGNKYGGERRLPTPPPSAGTPPFSLEPVTLVTEKQGNSVFKNIPRLFGVKLGCLFMKNHQLLNMCVKLPSRLLCPLPSPQWSSTDHIFHPSFQKSIQNIKLIVSFLIVVVIVHSQKVFFSFF